MLTHNVCDLSEVVDAESMLGSCLNKNHTYNFQQCILAKDIYHFRNEPDALSVKHDTAYSQLGA